MATHVVAETVDLAKIKKLAVELKTAETGGAEIEATLKPPVLMRRKTVSDRFEIAPENYPAPFRTELKTRGAIEE